MRRAAIALSERVFRERRGDDDEGAGRELAAKEKLVQRFEMGRFIGERMPDAAVELIAVSLREVDQAMNEIHRFADERAASARRLRRAKLSGQAKTERRRKYLVRELVEAAQSMARRAQGPTGRNGRGADRRAEDRLAPARAEFGRIALRLHRARSGEDINGETLQETV